MRGSSLCEKMSVSFVALDSRLRGNERSLLRRRLTQHRLLRPAAEIVDDAALAQRLAGEAGVAPVQDQPVMGVQHELLRNDLEQAELDIERRFARREAGA